MKKIIELLIWILQRIFNGKHRKYIEPCIESMYRKIASDDLILKTEIIKVKKGTRRYDLLFLETKEGRYKFNLGRHTDWYGYSALLPQKDLNATSI